MAIIFKPEEIHIANMYFLWQSFLWYHIFLPCEIDLDVLPTFDRYILYPWRCSTCIRITHVYSLWPEILHSTIMFDTVSFTLTLSLLYKITFEAIYWFLPTRERLCLLTTILICCHQHFLLWYLFMDNNVICFYSRNGILLCFGFLILLNLVGLTVGVCMYMINCKSTCKFLKLYKANNTSCEHMYFM